MTPGTFITDPADPRVSRFLNLRDRDLRRETGLFLAEGEHVVRRAFAAGLRVRSVLVVEGKVDRVERMIAEPGSVSRDVEVLVCGKDVIERAVGFRMHQGIIAACEPPPPPRWEEALEITCGLKSARPVGGGTIVVCPEITNTENLGLLVRVCAGLGIQAMVLGPWCCDPWYRRVVRVSMGAVFTMPMVRSTDLDADLGRLRDGFGYELIATVTDQDAADLRDVKRNTAAKGSAILLGSEGYGLPVEMVERCDRKVRIPMRGGIDSLNVAVAAGIVLWGLGAGGAGSGG